MKTYPHLFSPLKIGSITLKNRIEAAPVNISNPTQEGYLTPENILIFEEKARGGAAIVHMGECRIDMKTGISHRLAIPLEDPEVLPYLHAASDAIKRHNAIAAVEILHPGTRSDPQYYDGPIWGPSAGPGHLGRDYSELDEETIHYIVEKFGDAAEMAKLGNVDMVMVHAGHGWLLHQFLSPLNNRRTDKYGGSLENRARITLEVIENIRKKCGPDFPIELRMSGTEIVEGGLTIEDQVEFAKLIEGKVDLIHVTSGTFHVPSTNQHMIPAMFLEPGCNVYLAEAIKKAVKTPVVTVGALGDPDLMESILANGSADMIGLARPLLADPGLPNKIRSGNIDDIMPCVRCMACISESFVPYVKYPSRIRRCTVNPKAYKEGPNRFIKKAEEPKKVMVIGGGPAGMEAAINLCDRGHKVVLVEKECSLGGRLKHAQYVPFKREMPVFMKNMIRQIEKRDIEVLLNTKATTELAKIINPDVIVAAIGAKADVPKFMEHAAGNVMMALDVYPNTDKVGDTVAVVGGGLVGCELSLQLAQMGKKVTLVERKKELCRDAAFLHRDGLLMEMKKYDIKTMMETECIDAVKEGIVIKELTSGNENLIKADTIIIAAGFLPKDEEAESFRQQAYDFWKIGDCNRVRKVFHAMREGYNAGCYI